MNAEDPIKKAMNDRKRQNTNYTGQLTSSTVDKKPDSKKTDEKKAEKKEGDDSDIDLNQLDDNATKKKQTDDSETFNAAMAAIKAM